MDASGNKAIPTPSTAPVLHATLESVGNRLNVHARSQTLGNTGSPEKAASAASLKLVAEERLGIVTFWTLYMEHAFELMSIYPQEPCTP